MRFGAGTFLAALSSIGAMAVPEARALENHVRIESRTFYPGQEACTVGVFIENAQAIAGVVVPLEMRGIDAGAYPTSVFGRKLNPISRLAGSSLVSCPEWGPPACYLTSRVFAVPDSVNCSGPVSRSWNVAASSIDFISPDAMMFAAVSTGEPGLGEPPLDPGRDGDIIDSASFWIWFNVAGISGQFEIDTCCVRPMNHLAYADSNVQIVVPSFTKGIITIACQCPCASDPNCDGVSTDILDVFETINVAFRGTPAVKDPGCARSRTDVNCDGVTDVVDAVVVGMVSFGGLDPAVYYCVPCE